MFSHFQSHKSAKKLPGNILSTMGPNDTGSASCSSTADQEGSSPIDPVVPAQTERVAATPNNNDVPIAQETAGTLLTRSLWFSAPEPWALFIYLLVTSGAGFLIYCNRTTIGQAIGGLRAGEAITGNSYANIIKFISDYGHIWGPTTVGAVSGTGTMILNSLFSRTTEIRNHVARQEQQWQADAHLQLTMRQNTMQHANEQGNRYFESHHYHLAATSYQQACDYLLLIHDDKESLSVFMQYMPVLTKRLECLYYLHKFNEAITLLTDVIEQRIVPVATSYLADSYKLRGFFKLNLGLMDEAQHDFSIALQENPSLCNVRILQAYLQEDYHAVIHLSPFVVLKPSAPLALEEDLLKFAVIEACADAARRLNLLGARALFCHLDKLLPQTPLWQMTKLACLCLLASMPEMSEMSSAAIATDTSDRVPKPSQSSADSSSSSGSSEGVVSTASASSENVTTLTAAKLMQAASDVFCSLDEPSQKRTLTDIRFLPLWCFFGNAEMVKRLLHCGKQDKKPLSWAVDDLVRLTHLGETLVNYPSGHRGIEACLNKHRPEVSQVRTPSR